MIRIDFLKNHSKHIMQLIRIWDSNTTVVSLPNICINRIQKELCENLNDKKLPITFIALDGNIPVGMCSLRKNDGIRPDLTPFLGSIVVDLKYQKQGIGKMLISRSIEQAKELGFEKLYLLTFDFKLIKYYLNLGWRKIATEQLESKPVFIMGIELI